MYVKKENDREPYKIIITAEEMKEAFRNPISNEIFREALISKLMDIYFQSRGITYTEADNEK